MGIKKADYLVDNLLCKMVRKLGDSNPRYGNPYGSLANCWFQPLTQTSFQIGFVPVLRCKGSTIFLLMQDSE